MTELRLGLRENLPQFSLLVLLNAFVGAMVGMERTVLPLLGEQEFGLSSKTAITSRGGAHADLGPRGGVGDAATAAGTDRGARVKSSVRPLSGRDRSRSARRGGPRMVVMIFRSPSHGRGESDE